MLDDVKEYSLDNVPLEDGCFLQLPGRPHDLNQENPWKYFFLLEPDRKTLNSIASIW